MVTLVTGATGNVGRLLVGKLHRTGRPVRALTRRPEIAGLPAGVPVVPGDLAEPSTLDTALAGVRRLFLFPVPETATTWWHGRRGPDPYPDSLETPVHEADIADVAFAALTGDGHGSAAYSFVGPPSSHRDQVAAIAAAVGRDVTIDEVSPERAREHYRAQGGWAAENADFLLGFADYSGSEAVDRGRDDPAGDGPGDGGELSAEGNDWASPELPTIEAIIGRPARTFTEWAQDHVVDFR